MVIFYNATWISARKSNIYSYNVPYEILANFKSLLQFNFGHLEGGFRYLGFVLKPNKYRVVDYLWLVKKIERRIANWSYRFLSLGGRITLIKVVLLSIPVFWCSLILLSKSIINIIRAKIFHFLWEGSGNERNFHLASWEHIALPKTMGG